MTKLQMEGFKREATAIAESGGMWHAANVLALQAMELAELAHQEIGITPIATRLR